METGERPGPFPGEKGKSFLLLTSGTASKSMVPGTESGGFLRSLSRRDFSDRMVGKLNIFQRTMLQWSGVHPYNAVHVVRWAGLWIFPTDEDDQRELEHLGLTGLSIRRDQGTFRYEGGPGDYHLRVLSDVEDNHS